MPKFAAGVVRFQNEVFPEKKELFERLSQGQSPEALFITCSDSRIETAMITQTDPGELFICRNAGNIVPPHTENTGGMTASIEFAAAVLKVPHIVICGHTECGAVTQAMKSTVDESLPHTNRWIGFMKAAVDIVEATCGEASDQVKMHQLLRENVILQLQHLRTHPSVAVRLAKGEMTLHGWVYDIKTGGVEAYDESSRSFLPVDEKYATEIAEKISANCAHDR